MLYTRTFFVKARWLYNGYSSLIRRLSSFLSFHGKSVNFDCFQLLLSDLRACSKLFIFSFSPHSMIVKNYLHRGYPLNKRKVSPKGDGTLPLFFVQLLGQWRWKGSFVTRFGVEIKDSRPSLALPLGFFPSASLSTPLSTQQWEQQGRSALPLGGGVSDSPTRK